MLDENKERWKLLCEQASKEQDPRKLHELIREINDLLEAKQKRLNQQTPPTPEPPEETDQSRQLS